MGFESIFEIKVDMLETFYKIILTDIFPQLREF